MNKRATKGYTIERLAGMTPQERHRLYENAKRLKAKDPVAQETFDLLESSGLSRRATEGGGLSQHSEIYLRMEALIKSDEGKKLGRAAAEAGLPAMAYIDPMLHEQLGPDYTPEEQITMNAGYITGEMMMSLGYQKGKQGVPLPEKCIAKTATMWLAPR